MSATLPKPDKRTVIYEDEKLYACLTSFYVTREHTVAVWKEIDTIQDYQRAGMEMLDMYKKFEGDGYCAYK